jgi:hypothetical protein
VARRAASRSALLLGAALLVAGCGSSTASLPRQDEDEPAGEFPVDVVRATFPEEQKLAQDSRLEIEVKNTGKETIPNISVTLEGFQRKLRDPNDPSQIDPSVADPERPVFVVDKSPVDFQRNRFPVNQSLVDREVNPPAGGDTAYVDTYSLGELAAGDTAIFRWDVSAVESGRYELRYEVNAGLDGKADAVDDQGELPHGKFAGVVESTSPEARVAGDGETIVTDDGRRITDHRGVIRDQ